MKVLQLHPQTTNAASLDLPSKNSDYATLKYFLQEEVFNDVVLSLLLLWKATWA
jgi:hypothetical protein